ncbi:RNA polymerase II transcription factor B subunit 5 [Zea mays]|uniref:General transcription and DNA repair factor IIH subunit TFB5 n=3 Tax=Zea mays TaxID=4577 RepID=A0A3L6EC40_MAIZE|nr:RNA polymerase II transcription factor B subunit 5 [Zea mays]
MRAQRITRYPLRLCAQENVEHLADPLFCPSTNPTITATPVYHLHARRFCAKSLQSSCCCFGTPTDVVSVWRCNQAVVPVQSTGKMVNAIKGLFISCDVPMAQFIVNLNASMPPSERFIVHMLDPTNMFVQPHVAHMIRSKIGEFRDQNSYEKPQ